MKFSASVVLASLSLASAQNLVDVATANGLTTLVQAALATGQDAALAGTTELTVFAPTNAAFDDLPAGVLPWLLKPENVAALGAVLGYHVTGGTVLSSSLTDGLEVKSLTGETLTINLPPPTVNDVSIVTADLTADNGAIHTIDEVLLPPGIEIPGDIPSTAVAAGSFETLVTALGAADLVDALSAPNGPFTVFAPTDDAFDKLQDGLVEELLKPENKAVLTSILQYHVISGEVKSTDLSDGMMAETLGGEEVTVSIMGDEVKINESVVTTADVPTLNGVIHIVDAVMIPPGVDVDALMSAASPSAVGFMLAALGAMTAFAII